MTATLKVPAATDVDCSRRTVPLYAMLRLKETPTVLVALPAVRAYTQKSPCVHAGAFWAAATRGAVASTAATAIANTVIQTRDVGGRRIGGSFAAPILRGRYEPTETAYKHRL